MNGQYDEVVNFWADGNYAANKMNADASAGRKKEAEDRVTPTERDEAARNKLAAYLWREETKTLRVHRNFYTGNMDAYHEEACCGGCTGEMELGYSSGGNYCCCHEGKTPLEQHGYQPKYPPVNGRVPDIFYKWGEATQRRYLERFGKELT